MKTTKVTVVLLFVSILLLTGRISAQITIDGNFSDWSGVSVLATDSTGDGVPLCDFTALYTTDDANYVYVRISLTAGSNLSTSGKTVNLFVSVDPQNEPATHTGMWNGWWTNGYDFLYQLPYTNDGILYKYTGTTGSDWSWAPTASQGLMAWNSSYNDVEVLIPKADLNNPNIPGFIAASKIAIYVQAYTADEIASDASLGGFLYTLKSSLPVEMTTFTATVKSNNTVELNWNTATEKNNFGFEVEKAVKNSEEAIGNWEKIGFVKGNGNSLSPINYSYVDKNASYGTYVYRLRQTDYDGKFNYSKNVEVNAGKVPNGFLLEQNYPNPFNPNTSIKFVVSENSKTTLKVYNTIGSEVATLFNGVAQANQIYVENFNSANLPSGVYFYKLQTEKKTDIKKMLLLK